MKRSDLVWIPCFARGCRSPHQTIGPPLCIEPAGHGQSRSRWCSSTASGPILSSVRRALPSPPPQPRRRSSRGFPSRMTPGLMKRRTTCHSICYPGSHQARIARLDPKWRRSGATADLLDQGFLRVVRPDLFQRVSRNRSSLRSQGGQGLPRRGDHRAQSRLSPRDIPVRLQPESSSVRQRPGVVAGVLGTGPPKDLRNGEGSAAVRHRALQVGDRAGRVMAGATRSNSTSPAQRQT